MLNLTWQPITLNLKTTFRIAHGASDQRHNVITTMQDGEFTGMGEAAAVAYHGESQAGVMAYLAGLAGTENDPTGFDDPFLIEDFLNHLPTGSRAARAAIDIALHDLWGRRLGQPLYRLFGLNPTSIPETSFTIAMDEPAKMAERARQSNMPVIKIKLGSQDDEAIVAAIRAATQARLRIDANSGWSREQAASLIPRLAQYNLEFVEQPLPIGDIEGLRWLREQKFGVPVFADENIKSAKDVAAHQADENRWTS
jgi:L-alanine-DL-glutamate epimerase-like enolase superfamily enzyme